MRAIFDDLAVIHDDDAVGVLDGGQAMGDDNGQQPTQTFSGHRIFPWFEFSSVIAVCTFSPKYGIIPAWTSQAYTFVAEADGQMVCDIEKVLE